MSGLYREYFDPFLTGLTATPDLQTLAFFNRNLVMEYSRQRAIADGVMATANSLHGAESLCRHSCPYPANV